MTPELKQKAYEWISKMSDERLSFIIRVMKNGDDCVQAFIDSGIKLRSEANRFVDEWEAQHK